jgi:anti-sigma B factor antagonist
MLVETIEGDGFVRVRMAGKLDILGAEKVGLPLATLSSVHRAVVVDIAEVSFIASIAIRHFVLAAKTLGRRRGQLVLLAPTPEVEEVLATMGVTDLLPIARSEAEAQELLRPALA